MGEKQQFAFSGAQIVTVRTACPNEKPWYLNGRDRFVFHTYKLLTDDKVKAMENAARMPVAQRCKGTPGCRALVIPLPSDIFTIGQDGIIQTIVRGDIEDHAGSDTRASQFEILKNKGAEKRVPLAQIKPIILLNEIIATLARNWKHWDLEIQDYSIAFENLPKIKEWPFERAYKRTHTKVEMTKEIYQYSIFPYDEFAKKYGFESIIEENGKKSTVTLSAWARALYTEFTEMMGKIADKAKLQLVD